MGFLGTALLPAVDDQLADPDLVAETVVELELGAASLHQHTSTAVPAGRTAGVVVLLSRAEGDGLDLVAAGAALHLARHHSSSRSPNAFSKQASWVPLMTCSRSPSLPSG